MQIAFENPQALWFLLLLPLLIFGHFFWLRHTKRRAMRFANFRALKRITGKKLITRNYTLLAVRVVVVLCAVLAASQTAVWIDGVSNDNAFVIAIDTSASMVAQDLQPSRIEAAKTYAKAFVDSVEGQTEFAVVSFSGVTVVEETLTRDRNRVKDAITDLGALEAGGTDIPGALIASTNLLLSSERGKAIILLTDGSNTLETFVADPVKTGINYARDRHVVIHTIGIGALSGPIGYLPEYYNISGVYNEENLQFMANSTGGVYYHAESVEGLRQAYADIAARTQELPLRHDLSPALMMIALFLVIADWLLISTRFRIIP